MTRPVNRLAWLHSIDDGRGMTCDVTLIGFGEAGSTFARAGRWAERASGYDSLPGRRAALLACGAFAADNPAEALQSALLVLSLVTPDQALAAAENYARFLAPGTLWCDGNSVAPDTKRAAAEAVESAGGRYIDLAILAPVEPKRLSVPLMLSGSAATEGASALRTLGFTDVTVVGSEVGQASAIKMIRSVMVKGIEALTAEMMLAAQAAGVADALFTSLDASNSTQSWSQRAAYNLERMTTHGERRAAEMEECARTLESFGVEPIMTNGTIRRQREMTQSAHRSEAA